MFQKLQKKIKELFEEKGQGVVEYALMLGFVAVIAVYLLTGSNLTEDTKANLDNVDKVATAINKAYEDAEGST